MSDEVVKAIALLLPVATSVNAPASTVTFRHWCPHRSRSMLPIRPSITPVPVVDTSTEELAANSRSVSDPDPNTPISSCAVKVIKPPAVKSAVLSSAASLIDPAVAEEI